MAAEFPFQIVFEAVLVENNLGALAQNGFGQLGGEAEVKDHFDLAGNHIGGTGAAIDIGNLEAGGWEEVVAVVPRTCGQLGQRRSRRVDGVFGQMWVGRVPPFTFKMAPKEPRRPFLTTSPTSLVLEGSPTRRR